MVQEPVLQKRLKRVYIDKKEWRYFPTLVVNKQGFYIAFTSRGKMAAIKKNKMAAIRLLLSKKESIVIRKNQSGCSKMLT